MNYQETACYLEELNRLGSVPGLDTISELMRRLGNPENSVKFVHIAGTNGKGSVNSFVSTVLVNAGYKTGRFISPAVREPLEIIQLNNSSISEEAFADIISRIRPICTAMSEEGFSHPTRFEIETAAAFLFFYEQKCDIAVVECGMGGLLDSTNVISNTLCSVITPISLDHTGFLGQTIPLIAKQKAGIIKAGSTVVTYMQDISAMKVIHDECIRLNCGEIVVNPDEIQNVRFDDGIFFDYKNLTNIKINLLGTYQVYNAAAAIEVLRVLRQRAFNIPDKTIYKGLEQTAWFGRFSRIAANFYVDGAHNPQGAKALADSLNTYFPDKKLTFIIGVFKDKDYKAILDTCIPYTNRILTIETPDNERAMPAKDLADFIKKQYDVSVEHFDNIQEAVNTAVAVTEDDSAIIAFGSLSHLAAIEKACNNITR